jgi:hypothetical protein
MISWQLNGATEYRRFQATSAHDFLKQLSTAWDEAIEEGADFLGSDEPILQLEVVENEEEEGGNSTISLTIARENDTFFAKTDDIVDLEDWEAIGINIDEFGNDDDPEKLTNIFSKVASIC